MALYHHLPKISGVSHFLKALQVFISRLYIHFRTGTWYPGILQSHASRHPTTPPTPPQHAQASELGARLKRPQEQGAKTKRIQLIEQTEKSQQKNTTKRPKNTKLHGTGQKNIKKALPRLIANRIPNTQKNKPNRTPGSASWARPRCWTQ